MKEAITVSNVSKHFHRKTAVNHISFSIEKGEIAYHSRAKWGREDDRHLYDIRIAEAE